MYIPIALKAGFCSGTALGAEGALGAAFSTGAAAAVAAPSTGGAVGLSDIVVYVVWAVNESNLRPVSQKVYPVPMHENKRGRARSGNASVSRGLHFTSLRFTLHLTFWVQASGWMLSIHVRYIVNDTNLVRY